MLKKPIRPLLYNIKVIIYKNDKIFNIKLFEDFDKYEFWIEAMKIVWEKKILENGKSIWVGKQKSYFDNYEKCWKMIPFIKQEQFINKIKVFQLFIDNTEMLLTTWEYINGKLSNKIYDEEL